MSSKKEPQSQVPPQSKGSWSSFLKVSAYVTLHGISQAARLTPMIAIVNRLFQRRPFFVDRPTFYPVDYIPH
jgi:hypothetical protein